MTIEKHYLLLRLFLESIASSLKLFWLFIRHLNQLISGEKGKKLVL